MNTKTVTKMFDAPSEKVFKYFSDIENIPKWAPNFCKKLTKVGSDYKIIMGAVPGHEVELFMKIVSYPETKTIDYLVGPDLTHMDVLPSRLIAKGNSTLMLMTFVQEPYMDENMLELRTNNLKGELNLVTENMF